VRLVPLAEGVGVDLHNGSLGQGVGADELVVGRVEDNADDADLAGDALAAPREVAGVDAQGAELAVAPAGADEVDTLVADAGVCGLAALLESPVCATSSDTCYGMMMGAAGAIGLCIPLLTIVCALRPGG
jgi:hypothetical protein